MYLYLKSSAICFKKHVIQLIYLLSIAFSVIALSACGGGGGEEDSNVLPAATIDSSNVKQVTQVTVKTALELTESGDVSYIAIGDADALAAASRVALRMTPLSVRSVSQSQTIDCAAGGTMTTSVNMGSEGSLTVGDVIRIEADNCADGEGVVDGKMQMTIAALAGDPSSSAFLLGLEVVFTAFTLTESDDTVVFNGDIGISLDTRTPSVTTVRVYGDNFSVSSMGQTQSISSFSNTYTVDSSDYPVTWIHNVQGVISSVQLAGSVSYETPVSFEGTGDSYPEKGELLITGANNASLQLVAIDEVDVVIYVDYNGDGNTDETFYMTWAELMQ